MGEGVHDALPGDVYVDSCGKLWRCIAICDEPTRVFQAIEEDRRTAPTHEEFERKRGGVSGLMWNDFKRIYRPAPQGEG